MDLYIGLVVSLASTAICVVSTQGKVVKETAAPSEPEDLVRVLRGLPRRVFGVGLEAAPLSLSQCAAGPALGYAKGLPHMVDAPATARVSDLLCN